MTDNIYIISSFFSFAFAFGWKFDPNGTIPKLIVR